MTANLSAQQKNVMFDITARFQFDGSKSKSYSVPLGPLFGDARLTAKAARAFISISDCTPSSQSEHTVRLVQKAGLLIVGSSVEGESRVVALGNRNSNWWLQNKWNAKRLASALDSVYADTAKRWR